MRVGSYETGDEWLICHPWLDGYKRSDLPASKPAKAFLNEEKLRLKHLKWDTIVKEKQTMRAASLLNPFLILHAMGHKGFESSKIKYFVAITVNIPKYEGNLYNATLQNYKNLVPIEIRNINKVMIPV